MEATTIEGRRSETAATVRTDPRASNIIPIPHSALRTPQLLDAPQGMPSELFFEQQCLLAVAAIRERVNNFAHAVEVWRRYFPGEEFPAAPLAELQREHERVANLICRANDAVNLTPGFPFSLDQDSSL